MTSARFAQKSDREKREFLEDLMSFYSQFPDEQQQNEWHNVNGLEILLRQLEEGDEIGEYNRLGGDQTEKTGGPRVGRGRGRGRGGGRVGGQNQRLQGLLDEIRRNRSEIQHIKDKPVRPALQIPSYPVATGSKKPSIAPVIQKVTVTQKVGKDKVVRKKKIKAVKKSVLQGKRKEYATLKKQVKKALSAEKKAEYVKKNETIKKLPSKERPPARKKLRSELKKKFETLLKQIPAVGKKTHQQLSGLLTKVRKIKWI